MKPRPFLILKLPRTGSTTIQMALDSHPEISCTGEFLNSVDRDDPAAMRQAFQNFFEQGLAASANSQSRAFGATMNPFKYYLNATTLRQLIPDDCQLFCLTRKDSIRQAISSLLVKHNVDKGVKNAWNQPADYQTSATVDPAKLKDKVRYLSGLSKDLIKMSRSLSKDCFQFTYEDHFAEPLQSFSKILGVLGIDDIDSLDCFCGTRKLLQDDLRKVICNYDELLKDRTLKRLLS